MKKRTVIGVVFLLISVPLWADGVLRVGLYGLPRGMGNPFTSTAASETYVWAAIFDGLTRVDDDAVVQPALATRWQAVDEVTWRFQLREGVTFSNGQPFNADAVKATVDYLLSDKAAGLSVAREFAGISGARVLGEFQIEIRTEAPLATLPAKLAAMSIVEPGQWKRLGPDGFGRDPVGTGPFVLERWEPAQVDLLAFSHSWRRPRLSEIKMRSLPDAGARLQGLLSGQLDLALVLSPDDIAAVERGGARLHIARGGSVAGLSFITTKPGPLADVRVRRALNYAVDKESLAKVLMSGFVRAAGQPAPHYGFGYNPDVAPYPYDPEMARALLAEAGYPDGFEFIAEVVPGGGIITAPLYGLLVQQLAAVGVQMDVRAIPTSQIITKAVTGTFVGSAFSMEFNLKPTLDVERALAMHSCLRAVPWYCNENVTPLIEAVQAEFDSDKRLEQLQRLMQIYHDEAPMIFLYELSYFDGVGPRLKNYAPVNRFINYHSMYLED